MPFYVYVLGSKKINQFKKTYVGWTDNLNKRLLKHNLGKGAKSTRGRNWKVLYSEVLKSKSEALKKEYKIKKNRKLRKFLLNKI